MKLDTTHLRYLTSEDWHVLTAVEIGTRTHYLVPTSFILSHSHLRSPSAIHRSISTLAKNNLIARIKNAKYDGYRLTYGGLDYLALHLHLQKKVLYSTGNQIGVGKESDIFVVSDTSGKQHVLKIHRLGRISFRSVKTNRDYSRTQQGASWMRMSRLAALKEFTFMRCLYDNGFNVPQPIAQNRHTIVMSLIDAFPLRQIEKVPDPASLYAEMMDMIVRLAQVGLIHGDFNEFNILIKTDDVEEGEVLAEKLTPVLIDFPQMLSIDHPNAEFYFNRDVDCVKRFFERRFGFTSDEPGPFLSELESDEQGAFLADIKRKKPRKGRKRLDVEAEASGFSKSMSKELERYMDDMGTDENKDSASAGKNKSEDLDDEDAEDGADEFL
ncbi:MAG: hypothetical protein Q9190_003881 [Brigantiaea leucoxantha]